MILIIPSILPNLNDYITACRSNRFAGAKMKTDAEELIGWSIKKADNHTFTEIVNVHFHWVEPNMKRDKDNIAFAKKFILDALVENGILQGDGWKWVNNLSDSFAVDKGSPRIEVTIERARESE